MDVARREAGLACAADAERLACFTREARLLASLNHPNIAGVFGLEDESDTRFITMGSVESETLAERLAKALAADADRDQADATRSPTMASVASVAGNPGLRRYARDSRRRRKRQGRSLGNRRDDRLHARVG